MSDPTVNVTLDGPPNGYGPGDPIVAVVDYGDTDNRTILEKWSRVDADGTLSHGTSTVVVDEGLRVTLVDDGGMNWTLQSDSGNRQRWVTNAPPASGDRTVAFAVTDYSGHRVSAAARIVVHPAPITSQWGMAASYEGLTTTESWQKAVAGLGFTPEVGHVYSGMKVPPSWSHSNAQVMAGLGVKRVTVNVKTGWKAGVSPDTSAAQVKAFVASMQGEVDLIVDHEPENETPIPYYPTKDKPTYVPSDFEGVWMDPDAYKKAMQLAAQYRATQEACHAAFEDARGGRDLRYALCESGYNYNSRRWLEPEQWDPAFTAAERKTILRLYDVYPHAVQDRKTGEVSMESVAAKSVCMDWALAHGYPNRGFGEIAFNPNVPTVPGLKAPEPLVLACFAELGAYAQAQGLVRVLYYNSAGTAAGSQGEGMLVTPARLSAFARVAKAA